MIYDAPRQVGGKGDLENGCQSLLVTSEHSSFVYPACERLGGKTTFSRMVGLLQGAEMSLDPSNYDGGPRPTSATLFHTVLH